MYEIFYLVIIVFVLGGIYELYLEHQKREKEKRERERMKKRIEELEKKDA